VIGLVVRFTVRPESASAFDGLLASVLAGIREREPGTRVYAVGRDPSEPGVVTLLEVYRDAAAFEAHEAQPHTIHFLAERERHLAAPTEVQRLVVTDMASGPTA
jgi:quinol monooxygenase YgiN